MTNYGGPCGKIDQSGRERALAGGIAIVERRINAVAFFFHEKAWKRVGVRRKLLSA